MLPQEFEVNTDAAFINPDWENFPLLHEQRYGLAIEYIKHAIKGVAYDNKVMHMVVSDKGFYTQAVNFPAAFYGEICEATLEVIDKEKAHVLIWEAIALYRAGDVQSLTCIYSENQPDVFFGYRIQGDGESQVYELGNLRNQAPLHLRVMVDSKEETELLNHYKGVLIYQQGPKGEHLILKAKGKRQPFPLLDGFSD
ncbi:MAG: hypothetical protein R2880_02325 [Deinococcales bacterium]